MRSSEANMSGLNAGKFDEALDLIFAEKQKKFKESSFEEYFNWCFGEISKATSVPP